MEESIYKYQYITIIILSLCTIINMKTVKLITQEFKCAPEAAQKLESYITELKSYFNNHEDYDEDVIEDILIACEQKLL